MCKLMASREASHRQENGQYSQTKVEVKDLGKQEQLNLTADFLGLSPVPMKTGL